MKKIFSTTVVLAVMAIFISSAQAAINIKEATIENGQVFIAGKQAQRRAAISWEGVALGINSDRDGDFKFVTADLPPDCVGRLKVGTEERDVVINNCTPVDITVIEAGVPKTGQTTSFVTGEDGDLRERRAAANPRFIDNGDGTITDNLTGLIWLKNARCLRTQSGRVRLWQQMRWLAVRSLWPHRRKCSGRLAFAERNELPSLLDLGGQSGVAQAILPRIS